MKPGTLIVIRAKFFADDGGYWWSPSSGALRAFVILDKIRTYARKSLDDPHTSADYLTDKGILFMSHFDHPLFISIP